MLSAAKHLSRPADRPFASLRVTWYWDGMIEKIYFPYFRHHRACVKDYAGEGKEYAGAGKDYAGAGRTPPQRKWLLMPGYRLLLQLSFESPPL